MDFAKYIRTIPDYPKPGIMFRDISTLISDPVGAPGIEEVKWILPIHANDRLMIKVTCLETRKSKSRQDMGLVRFVYELTNQKEDVVMTMCNTAMFRRRPIASEATS